MTNLEHLIAKMLNDDAYRKRCCKFLKPNEIIDVKMHRIAIALQRDDFSFENLFRWESREIVAFAMLLANNGVRRIK